MPNPGDTHLSVNSVELEGLNSIATYYSEVFQNGGGMVAIASRKIYEYNSAAKEGGVHVAWDRTDESWLFNDGGRPQSAYKYRPTTKSKSHCGVETVRAMNELAAKKFARRLAGIRPHLFEI